MIQKFGDDRDVWDSLTQVVLTEYPGYIQSPGNAIRKHQPDQIKMVAHSIKGASQNMCFYQLALLATEMEQNSHAEPGKLQRIHNYIVLEWEKVRSILQVRE